MPILTDVDIRRELKKNIVIEPFSEESLTPVGYDFTVGDFIFCLDKGLLEPQNNVYTIPARSTVQILTQEALWVSSRIAGTFHSKVSLVSRGFSHISTTLDPQWFGPLLFTLSNTTEHPLELKIEDKFVTLIFYKVLTPTKTESEKLPYRRDVLLSQINSQQQNYLEKVRAILQDEQALKKFKILVKEADKNFIDEVLETLNVNRRTRLLTLFYYCFLFILTILVITLPNYWDKVKFIFGNIPYDSQIAVGVQVFLAGGIWKLIFRQKQ